MFLMKTSSHWTALLIGEAPLRGKIILVLSGGIACGLLSLVFSVPFELRYLIGSILAFDIGAGLLSNLDPSTAKEWRKRPLWVRWLFVIAHLTVYPLSVYWLFAGSPVWPFLLGLLLVKVGAFAWNDILRRDVDAPNVPK
jgi:hypothetical protein